MPGHTHTVLLDDAASSATMTQKIEGASGEVVAVNVKRP
jgi:hypothetical protein